MKLRNAPEIAQLITWQRNASEPGSLVSGPDTKSLGFRVTNIVACLVPPSTRL